MSRTKRFASSLGSGYLAMAANAIYSAASIPLALHYLTREEFGLWAVVTQIGGYLTLLDFGVGQSVSRILVDYKDDMNGGGLWFRPQNCMDRLRVPSSWHSSYRRIRR